MPSLSCVNLIFWLKPLYLECFAIRRGVVYAEIISNSIFANLLWVAQLRWQGCLLNLMRIVKDLLHLWNVWANLSYVLKIMWKIEHETLALSAVSSCLSDISSSLKIYTTANNLYYISLFHLLAKYLFPPFPTPISESLIWRNKSVYTLTAALILYSLKQTCVLFVWELSFLML